MKNYSGIRVILLFAYGEGKKINSKLAKIADDIAKEHGIFIFTQRDIANAYTFNTTSHAVVEQEKYISTLQIIDKFKKLENSLFEANMWKKWPTVLIIGVPQHLGRIVSDCKKELNSKIVPFADFPKGSYWYDSTDPQSWVRSPWDWWKQEIPIRIIRFLRYRFYAKKARSKARA